MQKSLRLVLIATLLVGLASANFYQFTKEFRAKQFGSEVLDSWTVTGFNDPKVTNCSGETLVGGSGVASKASLTKTFTLDVEIPEVNIQFDLYLIDSWNSGHEAGKTADTFQVLVDGKKVYTLGSDASRQLHGASSNICGGGAKDRKTKVSITVPITNKTFQLTFNGNMAAVATPTSASWGIRELYILGQIGDSNVTKIVSELTDDNNFDVSKWTSNVNNGVSTCVKKVLGGYGVAGPGAKFERKLENLPTHSFLTISLDAYFVDSLDVNDSIVFYVDGKIAHEQGKNWDLATTNVCGAGWSEYNQKLTIQVPHFSPTATIAIYQNSDQGAADESFGFRDFSVTASSPCPILYSEAEGQGKAFSFCGSIPNLQEVGWTFPIKGIFVPNGLQITVFENSQYAGKKYTISKTNLSLSGNEYVLVNKAFKIDVNEKKLRRQA